MILFVKNFEKRTKLQIKLSADNSLFYLNVTDKI
jgi:hypothetical protein